MHAIEIAAPRFLCSGFGLPGNQCAWVGILWTGGVCRAIARDEYDGDIGHWLQQWCDPMTQSRFVTMRS